MVGCCLSESESRKARACECRRLFVFLPRDDRTPNRTNSVPSKAANPRCRVPGAMARMDGCFISIKRRQKKNSMCTTRSFAVLDRRTFLFCHGDVLGKSRLQIRKEFG